MIIIVFGVPLPARMRCSPPCAPRQLPCRWFAAGLPLRSSSSWVSHPRAPRRPWRRCVVPRAPPMAALLAPPPASLPLVAPRALFGWVHPPWLTPSRLTDFDYSASTFPLCALYLRCEPPRVPRGLPLSCVHSALRGFVNFVVRLCCCALLRACGRRPLNFLGFRATPSPSAGGLRHPVSVVWFGWVHPPWLTPSRLTDFDYSASTFPLCALYLRCEPPRVPRGLPLSCVHSALRGFVNFVVRLCCCALLRACGRRPLNFLGFRATPSPSAGGLRHPVSVV